MPGARSQSRTRIIQYMPLLFWIVPYIMAGGLMWFVASQTAPFGREITLGKAILAVFFMGVCSGASTYWLRPMIGPLEFFIEIAAWIIVVKLILQLSFWRSVLAVFIYLVVMIAVGFGIEFLAKSGKPSP